MSEHETGFRVRLTGSHPWVGHTGTVVRWTQTIFGERPIVRLDDADDIPHGLTLECRVLVSENMRRLE